jgi:GTP-binding protein
MFIDQARIFVKAGSGGNGCNSLYRDKYVRRGKPDGGDGGDGGSVSIKADKSIQTLLDFQYKRHFKAEGGHHGSSNNKRGRRGKDFVILVPCGTIVKDTSTNLVLRDLLESDDSVVIAKCGRGGKGNSKGRTATSGEKGEEKDLLLELKLIADIGIIGYPNAGKSTFISKVSSAKSKIADYPFTTKRPILGIVRYYDERTLTFCDMPGLIEGAHKGRGLGDRFLRHIERTRLLLHMIDISLLQRKDPYEDFTALNEELKLYSEKLAKKKQIIVLNKIDLPGAGENARIIRDRIKQEVFPVSALTGEGTKELLDHIFEVAGDE